MKFFNLFLLILTVLFSNIFGKTYELAICAIFRNDANYLKEWIDFHLKQGVEHFFLYDNLSTDSPEKKLKKYIHKGIVEIIPWHLKHNSFEEWIFDVQNQAYMDCINKNKKAVKWCAFLDTDEFLFCVKENDIRKFLRKYDQFQEILVDWQFYGTSNMNAPPGKLISTLLYKANPNRVTATKCIVKPKFVTGIMNCHYFIVQDPLLCVNENKRPMNFTEWNHAPSTVSKIRINHYFCRDYNYFINNKINKLIQQGRDPSLIIMHEKKCNEVYDPIILKKIKAKT